MNCSRAQQLLSPYLDQQLTGAEMLEIQQHLAECGPCAEDYHSARQVKALLGSLSLSQVESSLESRILSRLSQEERRSEMILPSLPSFSALPALWQAAPPMPLPSRGRRLTAAFALSCLAVLAVAAPFAPSTPIDTVMADRAALGQAALLGPIPNAGLRPAPVYGNPWMRPVSVDTTDLSTDPALPRNQEAGLVQREVQPPLSDAGAEPLGDAAASGYVSGDVAFVGYRTR